MEDILKDFQNNIFMDGTNSFIYKELHKEEGFKDNLFFSIQQGEFDEKLTQECLDNIKPLLSNKKLIISNMPVVRYETNAYSVDENNTIEKIINHLEEDKVVLLFRPIVNNEVLNFKSRLL
jgi:Mn-containing catalase